MPHYLYKAVAGDGSRADGEMVASTVEDLLDDLRARRHFVFEVHEFAPKMSVWQRVRLRAAVSAKELAGISFQIASLIGAGVSLHETLGILAGRTSNRRLAAALEGISHDIEAGNSLHGALHRYRWAFGNLFVKVVKAGESSGHLEVAMEHLGQQYEEQAELNDELRGAMVYPIILVLMTVAVVAFLATVILPKFVEQFERMGTEIPTITRAVLGFSQFVSSHLGALAAGLVTVVGAVVLLSRYDPARNLVDGVVLRLPVVGSLIRRREAGRFASTFSLLQTSGVPLLENLDMCSEVVANRRIAAQLVDVREAVERGETLQEAMQRASFLPAGLDRVVAAGEQSGRLAELVARMGQAYDTEVRRESKRLVALLDPVLIVVLGVIVGVVALSLIKPMIQAVSVLRG